MISSLTNKRVKELCLLKTSKGRKSSGQFIVEGRHLVNEAKALGILVEVYTTDEALEGELVSKEVMKKLCNTDTVVNQIGVCKKIESNVIADRVLILDGVQDPGNLGALMRSAKAFDFNTIFLGTGTVDPYNDKVIRSSQGAIFKLSILEGDVVDFINSLKGYEIYSTNVKNGVSVDEIKKAQKCALILGNEGNGVSDRVNSLGLKNLYIKISNTESLNVAVAGSILMYEMSK
ncbi:MAG: RNA methyltransferase [Acholeplasmatales bacterium]|nr:RNA methyltransferase [Acholeplasmatales bacterium]